MTGNAHYWDCEAKAAALGSIMHWDLPIIPKSVPRKTGIIGTTNIE